jgi:hypothetical protein
MLMPEPAKARLTTVNKGLLVGSLGVDCLGLVKKSHGLGTVHRLNVSRAVRQLIIQF